jgi:hypothetical protein
MKRKVVGFVAVLIAALSSIAMAQTMGEVQLFNNYLTSHPDAARELAANPNFINNPEFLARHPHLREFLAGHPNMRNAFQSHPDRFMAREKRFESMGGNGPLAGFPDRGPGGVRQFDQGYLVEHPEVAHELGHNPSLADNPQFLATHPGLDSYLAAHPGVRAELQSHPNAFMSDEWRMEAYQHEMHERGVWHNEVSNFNGGYLNDHPDVASELSRNPGLADNPQFLATHPGLDTYLASHPGVRTQLQAHPGWFMRGERRLERREQHQHNGA